MIKGNNPISQEEIYNNDSIYSFLVLFYAEELSYLLPQGQYTIPQKLKWEVCQQMAFWLPHEKHYADILQKIYELRQR